MSKKFRRICALILAAAMVLPLLSFAEETDDEVDEEISEEQLREIEELDQVSELEPEALGKQMEEKTKEDFNMKSPAIYTCKLMKKSSIFSEKSLESRRMKAGQDKRVSADVLYVGLQWAVVRVDKVIGYVLRARLEDITPVDPVNTPPFGVQKHAYVATTKTECKVYKSMSHEDDAYVTLNPGTMLSILCFYDGWAVVNYWRNYGYIDPECLTDMITVSPTDEPLNDDTPIAAYTSYYKMTKTESNLNRITNIRVGCQRLTRVMQPGEDFNFNEQVGPYKKRNGYLPAPVLINGKSVPGYGGGTCQVSSTLYNVVLQLPGLTVIHRKPHGYDGASYLPIHVDAAVGNDKKLLNFKFRNDYDFPVRIEGHTSDDGALLMLVYKVSE